MADIVERLGTVGLWGEAREEILRLRAEVADQKDAFNKLNEMLAESLENRATNRR